EPGEAGCGNENEVIRPFDRQAKRRHVLEGLAKQPIKLLVAGLDLDDLLQPIRDRLRVIRFVGTGNAVLRRRQNAISVRERIKKTAVPGRTGFEDDLEAEPAIGIDRPTRGAGHANRQGAREIAVAVGGAEFLVRFGPARRDAPAAHDMARFYLEDIGKIAARRDLQLKANALHAMIGDIDIFMQAAGYRSADGKAEGALRNRSVLALQRSVGQKDATGVVAGCAAIERLPPLAIRIDGPADEDAGIAEIESLFAGPLDLTVRLADQHGLPLVDGNLLGADLDLERHGFPPAAPWRCTASRSPPQSMPTVS